MSAPWSLGLATPAWCPSTQLPNARTSSGFVDGGAVVELVGEGRDVGLAVRRAEVVGQEDAVSLAHRARRQARSGGGAGRVDLDRGGGQLRLGARSARYGP